MSLKEKLTTDMKEAMKAKESGKLALSVIRMVRANIKYAEIERKTELDDQGVLEVLAKEVKMRRDSMEEFAKGNRPDLVENLEREIEVLMQYLPKQLAEDEVRQLVKDAIAQSGAVTVKDMGKVMAVLMPSVKGKADGKLVNTLVREMLQS
ncbi:MAG: GatB/YqeY domain-containing protein [Sporomusaceae bacterium]|nr:GatB/YqeY domain-containing protein [Sporomusaceae bacterium]